MRAGIMVAVLFAVLCSQVAIGSTSGIGWIPTWNQACSEAAKTGKPILLVAAAPQCAGVSGIW